MKIIEPSVEVITPIDGMEILKTIELAGRTCYKSEDKITDDSCIKFAKNILKRGHEAVIEHYNITAKFTCDRGVSHEIVRHRIASFCQSSTRYCNYSAGKFDSQITVIDIASGFHYDLNKQEDTLKYNEWHSAMDDAERHYMNMLTYGATPQEARSVLPNSLMTELVMTANLREWRNVLRLRCSTAAHPQCREIMLKLLDKLHNEIPVIFDDIWEMYKGDVDSEV